MPKHYVEFIYPGFITSGSNIKECEHRDHRLVEVPERCVQFRFFDREVGELNGRVVMSEPFNYSSEYYPGGRLMSRDDVEKEHPNERILIDNMRSNGYEKIVRNRFGGFLSPPDREIICL